jgi:hypothetical protein
MLGSTGSMELAASLAQSSRRHTGHCAAQFRRSRSARQPPIAVEAVECIGALLAIERAIKGFDAAGAAARAMSAATAGRTVGSAARTTG